MRRTIARWAVLLLALGPAAAIGDTAPQVVMATPGGGGAGAGIERFTARFSEAMVPLGDPRGAAPFDLACPVAGAGRWTDPRTFVEEFATPLPGGVTCAFTLKDKLKSLRGAEVGGQRRFTVDTGGPAARAVLPARYGDAIEEDQVFLVAANVAPDRASVAANAYCAVDGIGEKIAVDLLPPEAPATLLKGLGADDYRVSQFLGDAGLPGALPARARELRAATAAIVALKCRRPLPPGHDMALVWGAGIRSPAGRAAGADQRFDFTVRKAFAARFECARMNARAGCSPVEDAFVRFSAPIPFAAAQAIRLEIAGRSYAPTFGSDEGHADARAQATVEEVKFKGPLPESAAGRILLPADVRDESGRPLTNAQRFPLEVRFDAAPPLVKFAAPFGILEAKEGGVLPLSVRNVEPALQGRIASVPGRAARIDGDDALAGWLRRIDKAQESDFRDEGPKDATHSVNHTGDTPLLAPGAAAEPLTVALPGKGRAFEVVGIPLTKPGFYVVELASPVLGRALLGREAPRYVAAGALVTNMAVHFKWGTASSLAWVTALDSGKPVPGADIVVTDSCSGRALAKGRADALGRLLVRGSLGDPSAYGGCEEEQGHPLMVSARDQSGDFSFALTKWADGIAPYDFDLNFGGGARDDIFHTVFDRTLLRAGDTVHMKHILRRPVAAGFAFTGAMKGTLKLSHRGSDTVFELPLGIGADGIGESAWTAPTGAPQGDYDVALVLGDKTLSTGQSIRVDEYRLPTMRASIAGPRAPAIRPATLPLDLYVGYLAGGGASNMPVSVRAAFEEDVPDPKGWDGWTFGGRAPQAGVQPLDGDGNAIAAPLPNTQTLPATLDAQGAGRVGIDVPAGLDQPTTMAVEMDYQDANGETLTAARRIPLYPSALRLGLKTDGWLMRADDLRLKFVVLDQQGHAIAGRRVQVALYSREIVSARRRLIGGFYAYDNSARTTKLVAACSTTTDRLGLAECAIDPGVSGEVYVVATAADDAANVTRAVRSVWLAGDDEWWFGGDNGDRMDLVPEATEYKSTDTARLQVRMPFREATALVTVEREGVLSSFVTTLSGKDPVISVPLEGAYAPDVYVSVLAVRGRVGGWRLWFADLARRWHLPFFSREGAAPTALVDLAKPSFRLGLAKIEVGWDAHRLAVEVKTDRAKYRVRDVAQVAVRVRGPDGAPPRSAEVAFAAVDEALLQLAPNHSWELIDAMMGDRPLGVITSTAQMQVVGKRHYGRKALAAGGGGGGDVGDVNRTDFRPVLLWKGRVPLDAQGRARLAVPLSDSLSSFRLVAVASAGADRFGTGEASVRTTQDLTIYSGLPPLVRTGDLYGASFTLRNGSDRAMTVTAQAEVFPRIATAPPLTLTIPPNGAAPVTWRLPAPASTPTLRWTVRATTADGRAADRLTVTQEIAPAVPVETWAATLTRVGTGGPLMLAAPAEALPGMGGVEVRLSASLAPPLEGVRAYMAAYPYGCLEQRTSKAVVAGDPGGWARIAGDLPTYVAPDGLLRYFPGEDMPGSVALTAYILSITSEAGFALPQAPRARMIEALRGVVNGTLKDESEGGGEPRLPRLAALAALARAGVGEPAMLGRIGMPAGEMPTSALADWIVALRRIPGTDPAVGAAAEAELRRRLVYAGSRLDLADNAAAPWWMMTSGDEMALKALLAVIGRPGWQAEGPRLMVGVSLRQRRGAWDTTPANAWGVIAARRFAALYPPGAVAGTTTARLGALVRAVAWPAAAPLALPLPAAPTPLLLSQAGGAGPWAQVSLRAAVPLRAPLFAGYRIARAVSVLQRKVPGRLTRGDVLKVRITIDASADRNWVVVSDPIPGGGTIVGGLGGQSAQLGATAQGGEGVQPSYVERGQDAWRGYFGWLPRGRATVEYAVRLNGAGRFQLPPTKVEAMYSPDIRAMIPNAPVTVAMR